MNSAAAPVTLRQMHLQLGHEGQGDLVLQGEDVLDRAIVALCPDMGPVRIDELCCDAGTPGVVADTAFQNITHAQLTPTSRTSTVRPCNGSSRRER